MAADCFGDRVEKSAATHSIWACDFKGFDFDFVARGLSIGAFRHLIFVEIIFLHQPIGEAQCCFGLSLRRIGVIRSFKNRAHLFSDAV